MRMYKRLQNEPSQYFSCGFIDDNPFHWKCAIFGPEKSLYEGGVFPSQLDFPHDFPNSPPRMRFLCPMWHPNIDAKTGQVCISILHSPGEDPLDYELQQERWLPIHTVETIIVSVISMLVDPNCESPLNVEAAKEYRNNREEYNRKVRCYSEMAADYS